jgi:hypothetical protein
MQPPRPYDIRSMHALALLAASQAFHRQMLETGSSLLFDGEYAVSTRQRRRVVLCIGRIRGSPVCTAAASPERAATGAGLPRTHPLADPRSRGGGASERLLHAAAAGAAAGGVQRAGGALLAARLLPPATAARRRRVLLMRRAAGQRVLAAGPVALGARVGRRRDSMGPLSRAQLWQQLDAECRGAGRHGRSRIDAGCGRAACADVHASTSRPRPNRT